MKTKIEIEIRVTDKRFAGLVNAMGDDGFIGVTTTQILTGMSQEPDEWTSKERILAFEKKLNEQDENFEYEVVSIKKVIEK